MARKSLLYAANFTYQTIQGVASRNSILFMQASNPSQSDEIALGDSMLEKISLNQIILSKLTFFW